MVTITDQIKALENANLGDIYIWFTDKCSPIVYEQSAVHLNAHFPKFPIVATLCSDGQRHKIVTDFPFEIVVENCDQLVDDYCIHIMNIKTA